MNFNKLIDCLEIFPIVSHHFLVWNASADRARMLVVESNSFQAKALENWLDSLLPYTVTLLPLKLTVQPLPSSCSSHGGGKKIRWSVTGSYSFCVKWQTYPFMVKANQNAEVPMEQGSTQGENTGYSWTDIKIQLGQKSPLLFLLK